MFLLEKYSIKIMKLKEVYDELVEVAKKVGITVRKEGGKFRSGYCILKEENIIILNRTTTLEVMSTILAKALSELEVDNIYMKPAIRDIIDKEKTKIIEEKNFQLEVKY